MELVYLVITTFWILVIILKKNSNYALMPAFFLYLVSAFFAVFNLMAIAEQIMRVSFIGWILGVVVALIEYKKLK